MIDVTSPTFERKRGEPKGPPLLPPSDGFIASWSRFVASTEAHHVMFTIHERSLTMQRYRSMDGFITRIACNQGLKPSQNSQISADKAQKPPQNFHIAADQALNYAKQASYQSPSDRSCAISPKLKFSANQASTPPQTSQISANKAQKPPQTSQIIAKTMFQNAKHASP
ncbi:MAG: hypothetical protein MJA83_12800 [Gammaproteobacteria bacterium]|nr:hypothetical protein [Gammaproteobacteria bacterium]